MPTIEQARAWYTNADAVHDFDHVLRVYRTAEKIALIEGGDLEIIHAAALLHDATGATPGAEVRANHHQASADFAASVLRAEGWPEQRIEAVQHCIRAHRFRDDREPPATPEARAIFDADKLDVLGAIGVQRVLVYAALAGTPPYYEPSETFLRTGKEEPGEPHSAYHEHLYKLVKVKDRLFTPTARALAEQRLRYLEGYFEQLGAELRGER